MEAILLALLEELAMKELAILIPQVGELVVAAIAALASRIREANPSIATPVQDSQQLAVDVVRRMESIDWGVFLTKDEVGKAKASAALNDLLGQSLEHGLVLAQNDAELLIRNAVEIIRTKLAAVLDAETGPKVPAPKAGHSRGSLGGGYGWTPDRPDQRDLPYSAIKPSLAQIPDAIDLRGACPAIVDQGQLGSCTANALAAAVEQLMRKDKGHDVPFSRLFIYYNERAIEHTVGHDSGAQIRNGVKTLVADGACFEVNWPYEIRRFTEKPNLGCYAQGSQFRVTSYHRLNNSNLTELLSCLAEGYGFVFGVTIYESFETALVAKDGIVSMPGRHERSLGGHAMFACGYDMAARRFLVRNSWGTGWGIHGYCWIPFEYLTSEALADDFWTVRAGVNL